MANLTITNLDTGNVVLKDGVFKDETLTLSGAQTVSVGQILARSSSTGKLVNFIPGGQAIKSTANGPFNLAPADTMVLNTNAGGNETATWDAASATITDTTTYAVTDQDTKTMTITITGGEYDGEVQTVTFSGATTTALQVAAGINAQAKGVQAAVVGGQVKLTTDGAGSGFAIATGAGTGDLTWAAAVAGTGDAADINAVTATEVKTVVEADTTNLTVTVSGTAAVFTATTSIQFVSGNALALMGLSVETVYAYDNGTPKALLTYELAGANGDNNVRVMISGEVRDDRLVIADGSSMTDAIRDQLRDFGIVPQSSPELLIQDNQ